MPDEQGFCPHCGATRPGWARFCAVCGNAYDAPPTSMPDRDMRVPATILTVFVIVAVLVAASLALRGARLASGPASAAGLSADAIPPSGQLWFGTGFDPTTFALSGRSDQAPTGTTVAVVAHLSRAVRSGEATLRVERDDATIVSDRLDLSGSGAGDVVGWTFALPVAGTYRITIDDLTGSPLSTGVVVAR